MVVQNKFWTDSPDVVGTAVCHRRSTSLRKRPALTSKIVRLERICWAIWLGITQIALVLNK